MNRLYQVEAIKRTTERLTSKHRRALIVQVTGTGKTRVAVALTELLIRAGWVKRVLFICDRRELRKQAKDVFGDFLNEPLTVIGAPTAGERDKRIYLATYPAMMKIFQTFDVAFRPNNCRRVAPLDLQCFRRSISLLRLFADRADRHTRRVREPQYVSVVRFRDSTAYYSFERAVEEGYPVPFQVHTYTTDFLRRGIKYDQLTDEQRKQIEESGSEPELLNFEVRNVDKNVYNKDTNRHIIRNLMANGIRNTSG